MRRPERRRTAVRIHGQVFTMDTELDEVYADRRSRHRAPLSVLVEEHRGKGTRIRSPLPHRRAERFFRHAARRRLTIEAIPLARSTTIFAVNPSRP